MAEQEAGFYHRLPEGTLQCDLCYHFCRVRENRTGICKTRINRRGKLFTMSYGHPASIGIDPVEKKPLHHFLPGTETFSLGTFGCNFTCKNCQNWEISQQSGADVELRFRSPESIVQDALAAGCPSISFTYNEPTIFAEYALDIMALARSAGLKNIWVSNGYMSNNCLDALEPLLDAINIDLKSMDESFYRKICGALLDPVLNNLKHLARSGKHLEVTTLLIPGHSDSPEMLRRLAEFIAGELGPTVPWHISAVAPQISWKMHGVKPTSAESIENAYLIGKDAGLAYIYDAYRHENTLCPKCGRLVIERRRYTTIRHDRSGNCPGCGHSVILHF